MTELDIVDRAFQQLAEEAQRIDPARYLAELHRRRRPRTLRRPLAVAAGVVALAGLAGAFALSGDDDPTVATVDSEVSPGTTTIPGSGTVDVPLGNMRDLPSSPGTVGGDPIGVAGPGDRTGWVDPRDFTPTRVPVDPNVPQPMVPIRDRAGRQIAWWSQGMGWVSFDTVSEPGYDYLLAYRAWRERNTPTCEDAREALSPDIDCPAPTTATSPGQ